MAHQASTEKVDPKYAKTAKGVGKAPATETENSAAVKANEFETAKNANQADADEKENTAEKVENSPTDVNDEVCPDEIYEKPLKQTVSMGTQTLES